MLNPPQAFEIVKRRTHASSSNRFDLKERIGAFFYGKRASGATVAVPVIVQAGRDYCYNGGDWGDYSYTSIDPSDGSFWTVQEYAEKQETPASIWGTWISSIKVNP